MKTLYVTSTLLLFCLSAYGEHDQLHCSSFYGQVLDAQSLRPIAGARVVLTQPKTSILKTLLDGGMRRAPRILATSSTDRNGTFTLNTAHAGPYDLAVARPGPHAVWALENVVPNRRILVYYKPDPKPHP